MSNTKKATAPVTVEDEVTGASTIKAKVKGIKVEIPTNVLNDFEVMVCVMAVDMGDEHAILHANEGLKLILGPEQYRTVMNELRDEDGRIGIEEALTFFVELIKASVPNS